MQTLLLGVIRLYWFLIPESRRRSCIFRESCSRYVFRITSTEGFVTGYKALRARIKKCRPGYRLLKNGELYELHLKDGSIIPEDEIALRILPYDGNTPISYFKN